MTLNVRGDFLLLQRSIAGRPVVYLDNAATTLKPRAVLNAVAGYETEFTANIHRGQHALAEEASEAFEAARRKVARFVGAEPAGIVFTANATAGINLVAAGLDWSPGANIVTTLQEHHSNLLPWYGRAETRLVPVGADGVVDPERLLASIDDRTELVTVSQVSNAHGGITDLAPIIAGARSRGVRVLVDGAQSVPHLAVDFARLGCDFLVFSAHKMLGPTGVGVLVGNAESLGALRDPVLGGGMVDQVTPEGYTTKRLPYRLEAGTPNIGGVIGLGAAVDYLEAIGFEAIEAHGRALATALVDEVSELPHARLIGPSNPDHRLPIASIVLDTPALAPDQVALMLSDSHGIMVRAGHHCCHPYFDSFSERGSVRASAYIYNTEAEVRSFGGALRTILETLGG